MLTLQRNYKQQVEILRLAKEASRWIEEVLKEQIVKRGYSAEDLLESEISAALRDGTLLCRLICRIEPGIIARFHDRPKLAFLMMENLQLFLEGSGKLGLAPDMWFQPAEVIEGKNFKKLIRCIHGLADVAELRNFEVKMVREGERIESVVAKKITQIVIPFAIDIPNLSCHPFFCQNGLILLPGPKVDSSHRHSGWISGLDVESWSSEDERRASRASSFEGQPGGAKSVAPAESEQGVVDQEDLKKDVDGLESLQVQDKAGAEVDQQVGEEDENGEQEVLSDTGSVVEYEFVYEGPKEDKESDRPKESEEPEEGKEEAKEVVKVEEEEEEEEEGQEEGEVLEEIGNVDKEFEELLTIRLEEEAKKQKKLETQNLKQRKQKEAEQAKKKRKNMLGTYKGRSKEIQKMEEKVKLKKLSKKKKEEQERQRKLLEHQLLVAKTRERLEEKKLDELLLRKYESTNRFNMKLQKKQTALDAKQRRERESFEVFEKFSDYIIDFDEDGYPYLDIDLLPEPNRKKYLAKKT